LLVNKSVEIPKKMDKFEKNRIKNEKRRARKAVLDFHRAQETKPVVVIAPIEVLDPRERARIEAREQRYKDSNIVKGFSEAAWKSMYRNRFSIERNDIDAYEGL
jgi:hypothetical protein